jgi:hypothetical protein
VVVPEEPRRRRAGGRLVARAGVGSVAGAMRAPLVVAAALWALVAMAGALPGLVAMPAASRRRSGYLSAQC